MNNVPPNGNHRLLAALATIPACQTCNGEADWFPPVDILEDAEEYLFKIDLPNVRPEDIRVVIERDDLFISGERADPWHENKRCLRVERPHGYFERRFALPDDASRVEIEPLFKECVLELHLRKVSPFTPAQTTVAPPANPPKLKLAHS